MSSEEQIKAIRKEIENTQSEVDRLHVKERELNNQLRDLVVPLIKEKKLLSRKFVLKVYANATLLESEVDEVPKELQNLIRSSYHCHFPLTPTVTMYFDDDEFTIRADKSDDVNSLLKVVNEFDMIVDLESVKEDLSKTKEKVELYEQIINKF